VAFPKNTFGAKVSLSGVFPIDLNSCSTDNPRALAGWLSVNPARTEAFPYLPEEPYDEDEVIASVSSHVARSVRMRPDCDEYTGSNGQVGPSVTHNGHRIDTSTASNGSSTSAIVAEVCKQITSPVSNGFYPVYVDVKRGNAGYCAYHTFGSCSGVTVQVAFFFNLDGDPGCDPQDTSGLHSQGLAALANVSGHELSEARTDPDSPGAWYDKRGQENGDKCAWTFNVPLVTFSNGIQWKIQGEWSNNAYNTGTGYPNSSGQKGCLDGH
jgi:hypothetical protein